MHFWDVVTHYTLRLSQRWWSPTCLVCFKVCSSTGFFRWLTKINSPQFFGWAVNFMAVFWLVENYSVWRLTAASQATSSSWPRLSCIVAVQLLLLWYRIRLLSTLSMHSKLAASCTSFSSTYVVASSSCSWREKESSWRTLLGRFIFRIIIIIQMATNLEYTGISLNMENSGNSVQLQGKIVAVKVVLVRHSNIRVKQLLTG